ncbi:hypothetical protein LDENG_00142390 [Lucifuga dentata]|nr:hypothetical protein LDENG_00142390 [Lucifuga dentata]
MTRVKVALFLTCLLVEIMAHITALKRSVSVRQERAFISANVGDSVTLRCFSKSDTAVMFYWFKQTLGQKPRLISTFYKHDNNGTFYDEFKDNPRFTLEIKMGEAHLKISNLNISDSATYYCIRSYLYKFEFAEGTTVSVNGSGLNLQSSVYQPASATIQPGNSAPLSCTVQTRTCDGVNSVYWFRSSEESFPGIIYSNGVRNDQCERKPTTQAQTCVYNLPMNVSDAASYYCAVVSCGEMLFGNETKTEHKMDPLVLVCFLSGALAITTVLVVVLAFLLYKMKKRNSCQCTDCQATTSADHYQDAGNLHYAAIMENHTNRRQQRYNTGTDCVYSSVRQ